ncbi:hypothetical protein OG21DRAFT_666556 [Imleria badia]|nr:hypothetical protein OG21DRAFT_666556 [Imleria badia]
MATADLVELPLQSPHPRSNFAVNIGTHWDQLDEDFISKVRKREEGGIPRTCKTRPTLPTSSRSHVYFHSVQRTRSVLVHSSRALPQVPKVLPFIQRLYQGRRRQREHQDKLGATRWFLVCTEWYDSFRVTTYKVGVNPDDGYRTTDFGDCIGPSPVDGM